MTWLGTTGLDSVHHNQVVYPNHVIQQCETCFLGQNHVQFWKSLSRRAPNLEAYTVVR